MATKKPAGLIVAHDTLRTFMKLEQTVSDVQQRSDLHNQRLEILEKHAREMQTIPATVSGLNTKVESLERSMVREVDGLREQQKSHKEEMGKQMTAGFNAVHDSITELGKNVDGMQTRDTKLDGMKDFVFTVGAFIVGFSAVGLFAVEVVKFFKS